MTRLIKADALIDDIEHNLWDWETVDGITASTVLKQTISDIKNQPTVEAIPIEWIDEYMKDESDFSRLVVYSMVGAYKTERKEE